MTALALAHGAAPSSMNIEHQVAVGRIDAAEEAFEATMRVSASRRSPRGPAAVTSRCTAPIPFHR
jgi:hypothetical protein